jgi:hypothetical protein
VLGVLAILLLAFFLWRRKKHNNSEFTKSGEAPASYHDGNNLPEVITQAPQYPYAYNGQKGGTSPTPVYEMPHDQHPVELPADQRSELR